MEKKYFFIDESGSPQFYGQGKRPLWTEEGFVPVLLLGMIATEEKETLRDAITGFREDILRDSLFNSIYSVRQPGWFFHASKDHSDINLKMVEFLRKMEGFRYYAVVGRKIPEIFHAKHNGSQVEFYFDLISKLLNLVDLDPGPQYFLYLSQRQSSTVQRFVTAFEKAVEAQSKQHGGIDYRCSMLRSRDSPEMSIVDYLTWALQRYILKGENEKRYFLALEHHYHAIWDIYENEGQGRKYTQKDKFDLVKASPFGGK